MHEKNFGQVCESESGADPNNNCLSFFMMRILPLWNKTIAPAVQKGIKILIVAHRNSLRALVKELDHMPDDQIINLNIPTGIPLVYELDDSLKALKKYYLGDPQEVQKALEKVANQSKVN